jgi:hypothetical protein
LVRAVIGGALTVSKEGGKMKCEFQIYEPTNGPVNVDTDNPVLKVTPPFELYVHFDKSGKYRNYLYIETDEYLRNAYLCDKSAFYGIRMSHDTSPVVINILDKKGRVREQLKAAVNDPWAFLKRHFFKSIMPVMYVEPGGVH